MTKMSAQFDQAFDRAPDPAPDAGAVQNRLHPTPAGTRPFLFDVTRLVWRVWKGRFPTGIDRICLAYLDRFATRSQAVVQRGRFRLVLSAQASDRLYDLLRKGGRQFRKELPGLLAAATLRPRRDPLAGRIYLNVGHTGLDSSGLAVWLARHKVRPVFLICDLIPITHPQFCRAGEDQRHRRRIGTVLDSAAGIIAISDATLTALAEFAQPAPLPPGVVALLGSNPLGPAPAPVEGSALPAFTKRPCFVIVGTIEARKNHLLLLRVWERLVRRLGDQAPELVIIGQRGWEADDVFAWLDRVDPARDHVHELGRCDDATMLALIRRARALLMPSYIEGFGIPVIEALQQGTPVIANNLPVYRELAGDAPLYLDPDDVAAWEEAIIAFTDDSPARRDQMAALRNYCPPDWDQHFAIVEDFLRKLPD